MRGLVGANPPHMSILTASFKIVSERISFGAVARIAEHGTQ